MQPVLDRLHLFMAIVCIALLPSTAIRAQKSSDQKMLETIHKEHLLSHTIYPWLYGLSEGIGGRLAGSPESLEAVKYVHRILDTLGLDRVYNQPCSIPNYWTRGPVEKVELLSKDMGKIPLPCTTLGGSSSTPMEGLMAEVIEVHGIDEVEQMDRAQIEGKIVFYNRPMDPATIVTFHAYGKAVDQRVFGPEAASKLGAVGCIVRSMTNVLDDVPHTGVTIFRKDVPPIPAMAISTLAADKLSEALKSGSTKIYMKTLAKNHGPAPSYNVIGEIKGKLNPSHIILVGGHLDAWDNGTGAHDDGAGVVQSMEVLHILRKLGYQPNNTIRFVAFMNEENGGGGAKAYADSTRNSREFHLAAIESDAGGFTPRGFTFTARKELLENYKEQLPKIREALDPFDLYLKPGGSGADIAPLKFQGGVLFGLRPDPQRYFNFHHTANDKIKYVNERELKMGAAAMTSLVYLLDQYLVESPTLKD